jgi:hypothetical protein
MSCGYHFIYLIYFFNQFDLVLDLFNILFVYMKLKKTLASTQFVTHKCVFFKNKFQK